MCIRDSFCDSPDRLEELCHKNNAARKKAGQYMILKAAQRYPISAELVMKLSLIHIFYEYFRGSSGGRA